MHGLLHGKVSSSPPLYPPPLAASLSVAPSEHDQACLPPTSLNALAIA
jgi:hypothetical protein